MENTNNNTNQGSPIPSDTGNQTEPTQGNDASQPSNPYSFTVPQSPPQSAPETPQPQPQHQAPPTHNQGASPYVGGQQVPPHHQAAPQAAPQPPHAQHAQHWTAEEPKPQKTSGGGVKTFFIAFAGAALALVIGFAGFGILNPSTSSSEETQKPATVIGSTESSGVTVEEDSTLAEAVAGKTLPSVANIDVYTTASSNDPFGFGYGSSGTGELTESSLGSGVVISEDGYIITNYHVIEGSEALKVTVDGVTYEASVVGADESSDLAVIKAEGASGLTPVEIGTSEDLKIGEWVMSIGSPFGLEQSVATGIVSATSRSQILQSTTGSSMVYTNLIQTDAAINPGNSGGALVDSDGKLIGINTLITSYSGNYSGVGFAIPVDYAISIAEQIINGETPSHAQLGVNLSTVTNSIAERYGLAAKEGAYVTQIYAGSGAEAAGIKVGDIITAFNGNTVASATDLMLEIRSLNPGDKAEVEFNRAGETMSVEVTLGSDADVVQQQSAKNKNYFGSNGYGNESNNAA